VSTITTDDAMIDAKWLIDTIHQRIELRSPADFGGGVMV
jgi:hypothetical protein